MSSSKIIFFPELLYLLAFKALYPPVPVQAHRTPRVFHPTARQGSIFSGGGGGIEYLFLQQWVSCQTSAFSSLTLSAACSGDSQTYHHQQALYKKVVIVKYYDILKNAGRIYCFSATRYKQLYNCMFTRVLLFFVICIATVPTSSRPRPGPVVLAAELTRIKVMVLLHS